MTQKTEKSLLYGAILAFVVIMMAKSVEKFGAFGFTGLDLGIYTQVFWNTAHGRFFEFTVMPGSYLGYHAEWLIVPLSALFAIIQHPLTLVFLQTLALASCAIPISRIAKRLPSTLYPLPSTLLFPLIWLLNPTVWRLGLYEFHLLPFAIPCLFWAADFYLAKKFCPFIVAITFALLAREDVVLAVAGFSLLAFFDGNKERDKRWIIVPLLLCLVAALVNRAVFGALNSGRYAYSLYYEWLHSATFTQILAHVLHPGTLDLLLGLLLPVFFLPLLRPRFLLLSFLPFLQFAVSSPGATDVILVTHYGSLLLSGLFVAAIEGAAEFERRRVFEPYKQFLGPLLVFAACFGFFTIGPGLALVTPIPVTARADALEEAVREIPSDASVVVPDVLLPRLGMRREVFLLRYVWFGKNQFGTSDYTLPIMPEYFIIDDQELREYAATSQAMPWIRIATTEAEARFERVLRVGGYGPIFSREGVSVYKKSVGKSFERVWKDPGEQPPAKQTLDRIGTEIVQFE